MYKNFHNNKIKNRIFEIPYLRTRPKNAGSIGAASVADAMGMTS